MKKQIRKSVFETNSSSTHVLTIDRFSARETSEPVKIGLKKWDSENDLFNVEATLNEADIPFTVVKNNFQFSVSNILNVIDKIGTNEHLLKDYLLGDSRIEWMWDWDLDDYKELHSDSFVIDLGENYDED